MTSLPLRIGVRWNRGNNVTAWIGNRYACVYWWPRLGVVSWRAVPITPAELQRLAELFERIGRGT